MKEFGDYRIMITSDHATPVKAGTHTDDAVPFMIYDSAKVEDMLSVKYSEKTAAERKIEYKNGWELFDFFIKK